MLEQFDAAGIEQGQELFVEIALDAIARVVTDAAFRKRSPTNSPPQ